MSTSVRSHFDQSGYSYWLGVRNTIKSFTSSDWPNTIAPAYRPVVKMYLILASVIFQARSQHFVIQCWSSTGGEAALSVNRHGEICNLWCDSHITISQIRRMAKHLKKHSEKRKQDLFFSIPLHSSILRVATRLVMTEISSTTSVRGIEVSVYRIASWA